MGYVQSFKNCALSFTKYVKYFLINNSFENIFVMYMYVSKMGFALQLTSQHSIHDLRRCDIECSYLCSKTFALNSDITINC